MDSDVFIKLMTRMSDFRNRSEFSTWLYRLVVNACLDRKRALRRYLFFGRPSEIQLRDGRKSAEQKPELFLNCREEIGTRIRIDLRTAWNPLQAKVEGSAQPVRSRTTRSPAANSGIVTPSWMIVGPAAMRAGAHALVYGRPRVDALSCGPSLPSLLATTNS